MFTELWLFQGHARLPRKKARRLYRPLIDTASTLFFSYSLSYCSLYETCMAKVSTGVLGVVEYILLRLMQMAYQVFNTLRFTRITISNTHGVRQPGTLSRSKSALRLSSCHSDLGGISITNDTCVLRTTSAATLKLPKSKSFAGVGIVAMVTDQIDIVSRNETAEDRRAREGQDMVLRFSSCTDSTRSYAASSFTSTRGRRIFVQKWTPAPPLKMKYALDP